MISEYMASKCRYENQFVVVRAALTIVVFMMMGAVGMLMPSAAATPTVSIESTAAADGSTVYFPAQYVNQATEIEPMPPAF